MALLPACVGDILGLEYGCGGSGLAVHRIISSVFESRRSSADDSGSLKSNNDARALIGDSRFSAMVLLFLTNAGFIGDTPYPISGRVCGALIARKFRRPG